MCQEEILHKKIHGNRKQYCFCLTFWLFWPRGLWGLSPSLRDQTHTPGTGRQSLSHWTTREVPWAPFLKWMNWVCLWLWGEAKVHSRDQNTTWCGSEVCKPLETARCQARRRASPGAGGAHALLSVPVSAGSTEGLDLGPPWAGRHPAGELWQRQPRLFCRGLPGWAVWRQR